MKHLKILLFLLLSLKVCAQDSVTIPFGLLPPSEDELKRTPYSVAFSTPPNYVLPPTADLSLNMPPSGNQGQQGSCAAWAIAYALKSYEEKIEHGWEYNIVNNQPDNKKVFSPTFIYNTAKLNRIPIATECKTGMTFYEAFNVAINYGVPTLADLPYYPDNTNGCLNPNPQKDQQLLAKAANFKISSFERLMFNDPNEIKYYISKSIPVVIGIMLDQSFVEGGWAAGQTGNKFIWNPNIEAPGIGYHAMVCVGYDENLREFKVLNSWGGNWGSKGYMYVPYDKFFRFVREAYIAYDAISLTLLATDLQPSEGQTAQEGTGEFTSWFKTGYYQEYNELRVGLTYLSSSKDEIIVRFTDIAKNKIIQSIGYKTGESKSFFFSKYKVTYTFNKVDRAGRNPLKPGVFFTIKFEETTTDPIIENVINKFKKDEERIINNIKNLQQQQQQQQQLQQQIQQQQQQK